MESDTKIVTDFLNKLNKITKNKKHIILMDESFSSIDSNNTKISKEYIMSLKDKIIIEVTHDITEDNLNKYDRIIYLEEGKIKKKI
ncbi:MAG: hypothetical protein H5T96_00150 [Tissierellales bacterium]|nr:hypothetical protein [Tissierellales bacterium]